MGSPPSFKAALQGSFPTRGFHLSVPYPTQTDQEIGAISSRSKGQPGDVAETHRTEVQRLQQAQ
jgi:hypothetical protein